MADPSLNDALKNDAAQIVDDVWCRLGQGEWSYHKPTTRAEFQRYVEMWSRLVGKYRVEAEASHWKQRAEDAEANLQREIDRSKQVRIDLDLAEGEYRDLQAKHSRLRGELRDAIDEVRILERRVETLSGQVSETTKTHDPADRPIRVEREES